MKHVLVTAGTVYGRLDDNKLVGNRIRGIWATKFAAWLGQKGYDVTLLIPDTMKRTEPPFNQYPFTDNGDGPPPFKGTVAVKIHTGYDDYADQCYALATKIDAAVMAAAVVNWIPQTPFKGKMPTDGFLEGAVQHIPFYLAPRVIDRMKKLNPKLTLIGCKMTSGALKDDTLKAAYTTLIKSHSNVVVANDLSNLKEKTLIYPDGATFPIISFDDMYYELKSVIDDEHYRTEADTSMSPINSTEVHVAEARVDAIIAKYFDGFVQRRDGVERVFGGLAVRVNDTQFLVSPREKGSRWTSNDTVLVTAVNNRVIYTVRGRRASLNAPVLIRHLQKYPLDGGAVLHQHRMLDERPTGAYAPPGTVRDNEREILDRTYNIQGHGFVSLLNEDNLMLF